MKREILELGLALGRSWRQVQQWDYRGQVPHKWRLPMLREAAARLVPLRDEDFVWEKPALQQPGRVSERSCPAKTATGRRGKGGAPDGVNQ